MKPYKLTANKRVQRLVRKEGTSRNETPSLKFKDFSLTVKCAAAFPHRIAELDNLVMALLNNNLYAVMKPKNIYSGSFEILEGFEDEFRNIASEHGFNACEMIECQ